MAMTSWNLSRHHTLSVRRHARSRKGQAQLEHGLTLALIALAALGSLITASHQVNGLYERAATSITNSDAPQSQGPSFSNFSDLNFVRGNHVTQGENGNYIFNGPFSYVSMSGTLTTNGVPTSITLQTSGGPPPVVVRVTDETTGGSTLAWYSGQSDASGNPTYNFNEEIWGEPGSSFFQGDTFSMDMMTGGLEGTTVVSGYLLNQTPNPPHAG